MSIYRVTNNMLLSTYRVTYQAPESVLGIEKVEFGGLKTVTLVVVWMPEAAEVCRSTRLVSRCAVEDSPPPQCPHAPFWRKGRSTHKRGSDRQCLLDYFASNSFKIHNWASASSRKIPEVRPGFLESRISDRHSAKRGPGGQKSPRPGPVRSNFCAF